MQVSTGLEHWLKRIQEARDHFEDAQSRVEQDKIARRASLWARIVDYFTNTPVERDLTDQRDELIAVMTSAGMAAEKWINGQARDTLRLSAADSQRHSAQLQRIANAKKRHDRVQPLLRLVNDACDKLDQARRDCESASDVELLDLVTTSKAASVWSSMETSGAADSIESAHRAVKALAAALPKRATAAEIDIPNDMLDLFVDIAFEPALDVLSWFNMGRLDDAARQCRKASEKIDPLQAQLKRLSATTRQKIAEEMAALHAIELPHLQAAAAQVPKGINFGMPACIT